MNLSLSPAALSTRIGIILLLTLAADFLLFRQPLGISVFIFTSLVAVAVIALHPRSPYPGSLPVKLAIAGAAVMPLAENVSPLSAAVSTIGLSVFALSISARLRSGSTNVLRLVAGFLVTIPFSLLHDIRRLRKLTRTDKGVRFASLAAWTLTVALGGVFITLFGIANPVIGYWISLIDLRAILELLDIWRLAFWLIVIGLVWGFLRPRLPRWSRRYISSAVGTATPDQDGRPATTLQQAIFGTAAILRALVVFNLLFAVQTVLDGAYLWGGVELPAGMTYATYAHRGAYALIVTALLAAVFVLAALRPGSPTSADRRVRTLVYLWSAQNVVLVISSILRLDLYVGIYSLTYWRVAAFIWMGLVAMGIVLIVARIMLDKSNEWLLGANMLTLSAVLYTCCFVNFAAIIAHYNVTHSREMSGGGPELDWHYLRSLGPAAIPATELFFQRPEGIHPEAAMKYWTIRNEVDRFRTDQQNWRAWSFRNFRLARHFERPSALNAPVTIAPW